MGFPPKERYCLGVEDCMRWPFPAAVIRAMVFTKNLSKMGTSLMGSTLKKRKVEVDYKPSSVSLPPVPKARTMIIHLRIGIAPGLKRPTRGSGAGHPFRPPIWSCSGWGLPGYPGYPGYRWALTPPFHPYQAVRPGGIFSVALSFSSPRLGVTQHPALWSSDFPPAWLGERSFNPLPLLIIKSER